jgi:predicted ATPase
MVQGTIWVQRGEAEAGLSLLTEGVAQYRSTEVLYLLPLYLAFMADAYRRLGRTDEGLTTVVEALHLTETHASLFWTAELYRLKGELTLQRFQVSGSTFRVKTRRVGKAHQNVRIAKAGTVGGAHPTGETEAEACFLKAIAIARQQEAKSLELRAAMSLSRLWQQQGKREEAWKLLAEIYGWFTEGFDTQDVREAKAVLDTLGA